MKHIFFTEFPFQKTHKSAGMVKQPSGQTNHKQTNFVPQLLQHLGEPAETDTSTRNYINVLHWGYRNQHA